MFDLCLPLEPYMAARAAERLSSDLRKELAGLAATMTYPASDDAKVAYGQFALQDARFYSWIAAQGANDLAADAQKRDVFAACDTIVLMKDISIAGVAGPAPCFARFLPSSSPSLRLRNVSAT